MPGVEFDTCQSCLIFSYLSLSPLRMCFSRGNNDFFRGSCHHDALVFGEKKVLSEKDFFLFITCCFPSGFFGGPKRKRNFFLKKKNCGS